MFMSLTRAFIYHLYSHFKLLILTFFDLRYASPRYCQLSGYNLLSDAVLLFVVCKHSLASPHACG